MEANDDVARETVCELANMVIGSAITTLNDQGFHFKIQPPVEHVAETGEQSSEDQEALVMCFDTENGNVFMNISLRYNNRKREELRPNKSEKAAYQGGKPALFYGVQCRSNVCLTPCNKNSLREDPHQKRSLRRSGQPLGVAQPKLCCGAGSVVTTVSLTGRIMETFPASAPTTYTRDESLAASMETAPAPTGIIFFSVRDAASITLTVLPVQVARFASRC